MKKIPAQRFFFALLSMVISIMIYRYPDFREPPHTENEYKYSSLFWHILAARLAFVVVFEVSVFFYCAFESKWSKK